MRNFKILHLPTQSKERVIAQLTEHNAFLFLDKDNKMLKVSQVRNGLYVGCYQKFDTKHNKYKDKGHKFYMTINFIDKDTGD